MKSAKQPFPLTCVCLRDAWNITLTISKANRRMATLNLRWNFLRFPVFTIFFPCFLCACTKKHHILFCKWPPPVTHRLNHNLKSKNDSFPLLIPCVLILNSLFSMSGKMDNRIPRFPLCRGHPENGNQTERRIDIYSFYSVPPIHIVETWKRDVTLANCLPVYKWFCLLFVGSVTITVVLSGGGGVTYDQTFEGLDIIMASLHIYIHIWRFLSVGSRYATRTRATAGVATTWVTAPWAGIRPASRSTAFTFIA